MAQVGNQHPDKLVPYWHAARQLTPAEAEAVGRIMSEQAERYIAERETMVEDSPGHPGFLGSADR